MRGGLGLVGLLVALAIVAFLARRQAEPARAPVAPSVQDGSAPAPAVPLQQQPQRLQEQVEALMRQPRPLPEDSQ